MLVYKFIDKMYKFYVVNIFYSYNFTKFVAAMFK